MADATDYVDGVLTQLWALLEAHTGFTEAVKAGNRIKLNNDQTDPFKQQLQNADLPQVSIIPGLGSFTHEVFTVTPHYGLTYTVTNDTTLSANSWKERHTEPFTITIVHEDLRSDQASALRWEIIKALRKGGAKLGLAYVHSWGPVSGDMKFVADTVDESGNPRGTKRITTTLNVPVTMWIDGQNQLS